MALECLRIQSEFAAVEKRTGRTARRQDSTAAWQATTHQEPLGAQRGDEERRVPRRCAPAAARPGRRPAQAPLAIPVSSSRPTTADLPWRSLPCATTVVPAALASLNLCGGLLFLYDVSVSCRNRCSRASARAARAACPRRSCRRVSALHVTAKRFGGSGAPGRARASSVCVCARRGMTGGPLAPWQGSKDQPGKEGLGQSVRHPVPGDMQGCTDLWHSPASRKRKGVARNEAGTGAGDGGGQTEDGGQRHGLTNAKGAADTERQGRQRPGGEDRGAWAGDRMCLLLCVWRRGRRGGHREDRRGLSFHRPQGAREREAQCNAHHHHPVPGCSRAHRHATCKRHVCRHCHGQRPTAAGHTSQVETSNRGALASKRAQSLLCGDHLRVLCVHRPHLAPACTVS